jgi:hypothetical protein
MAVRYLSAGRSAPLERYRGAIDGPDANVSEVAVGHFSFVERRHDIQSLTGDYLALHQRADLRIKVEARLQTLLSKRLRLEWTQSGLTIGFIGKGQGNEYSARSEASGVVHLAGMLAALYDDEVSALLIDEPEISLHPQWQRFLLEELKGVAGDPVADRKKKLIVLSTHSPAMLSLQRLPDISSCIFFTAPDRVPIQLPPTAGPLGSRALQALFARLGESHRQAFFAKTLLLVEGPSDETIAAALATRLNVPVGASSTQIVPTLGKDEMIETARLFRLLGKAVVVLADLDALADSPKLLQSFGDVGGVQAAAAAMGAASVSEMDRGLRTEFAAHVGNNWAEISASASTHHYYQGAATASPEVQRRAALALLLTLDPAALPTDAWRNLRSRYVALLSVLAKGGCFFIRSGTIENCFSTGIPLNGVGKPQFAAVEAVTFTARDDAGLRAAYRDMLEALEYAAPKPLIDENLFLRVRLAGLLASVFQQMDVATPNDELHEMARLANVEASSVFQVVNASAGGVRALQVSIVSPLFASAALPRVIRADQNVTDEVALLLP